MESILSNIESIKIDVISITCCCCMVEDGVITCSDGHFACYECINRGLNVSIGESKMMKCFFENCQCLYYPIDHIIKCPKILKSYDELMIFNSINNLDKMYSCPFCDLQVFIPNDASAFFCSLGCKKHSCVLCRKTLHDGSSCIITEQHHKDEIATNEYVITCCGISFFRGDACNKVTCTICKTNYCWICKSKNINYNHFKTPNNCKLYGDRKIPLPQMKLPKKQALRQGPIQIQPAPVPRQVPRNNISVQCSGISLNGNRCTKMTLNNNELCHYHDLFV